MTNILDPVPTWAIMLVSALLIFAMSEVGFQLGRQRGPVHNGRDPSILVQTSAFTVLALLLGFSFSLALARYDGRRATLLREANAINSAFLRAQVLDAKTASVERADLRLYIVQRLAYARSDADPQHRAVADATSTALQRQMWSLAIAAALRDPHSTMLPPYLAALNDMIALSREEAAILNAHIPDLVIAGLLLIAFIASAMMGYGFGREGKRALVFKAIFALMVALVFGLVLDLDRPQRGLIRINLTPLQTVQQLMNTN
ncbi:MAG: hypothetical protein WBD74_02485 [Candidatus Aquilonibacter sp.]